MDWIRIAHTDRLGIHKVTSAGKIDYQSGKFQDHSECKKDILMRYKDLWMYKNLSLLKILLLKVAFEGK